MDIFKFALDFEREHKNFYQKQARESENEYLKNIFDYLAEEERKHEKIVKQLSKEKKSEHIESDILPRAKEAFAKISATIANENIPVEQVDVYKKALEMETENREYYQARVEETELPFVRRAFASLAKEEKKHETIMRNLVEFVNRPNTWLDDAEWNHLEDY
jgi:rubrerythrin